MISEISGFSPPVDDQTRIKEAAGQFEALLIAQMLRSAREEAAAGSGNSTSASMFEMSEQHLAQALTAQGGLGLSKLIIEHLSLEKRNPGDTKSSGVKT